VEIRQAISVSRRLAMLMLIVALCGVLAAESPSSAVMAAPTPPAATISRYMGTVDAGDSNTGVTGRMYDLGCMSGRNSENGIVILDYGQPAFVNGEYGTYMYDTNTTFVSTNTIETAVKRFLKGYWDCSPLGTFLYVGVGTNDQGSGVTTGHASAWAGMINDLNSFILSPPSWGSQEGTVGAIDAEPGFTTSPTPTRSWVDAYAGTANNHYYDFGDCPGCPTSGTPQPAPGASLQSGWTQDDVWYVTWGNPRGFPLPEIYRTDGSNAAQWEQMSLYGAVSKSGPIQVQGSMTEQAACSKSWNVTYCQTYGLNNSPAQGWSQLWDAVNGDSRTAQSPSYSTDISWDN